MSSHLVAIAFGNKNIDKKWKMLWLRNWKTNYLLPEIIILALQNSQQMINCLANWNRIYRRWSTCLVNLPQMLIFHQCKLIFHIIFPLTLSFTCLSCILFELLLEFHSYNWWAKSLLQSSSLIEKLLNFSFYICLQIRLLVVFLNPADFHIFRILKVVQLSMTSALLKYIF